MKKIITIILCVSLSLNCLFISQAQNTEKTETKTIIDIEELATFIKEEKDIVKLKNMSLLILKLFNDNTKTAIKQIEAKQNLNKTYQEFLDKYKKDFKTQSTYELFEYIGKKEQEALDQLLETYKSVKTTTIDYKN